MLITHDTRCALDTVVDLVNTAPEDDTARTGWPMSRRSRISYESTTSAMSACSSELDLAAVRDVRGRFAAGLRGAATRGPPPR